MYFGLLWDKLKVGVAESEKRVPAIFLLPVWPLEPLGGSFLPYSGLCCHRIAHRPLEILSIRKPGAPNLNLWPGSTIQKPEVLSKVPEMVRNVVKLIVIQKTRVKSRRGQEMLEVLSIRKPGAPNLNLWPESITQKPEVLSKVPEMVRKVMKLSVN